jgi:multisubunit Na+/H+ antiporter MnhG subunit
MAQKISSFSGWFALFGLILCLSGQLSGTAFLWLVLVPALVWLLLSTPLWAIALGAWLGMR